jgi:hypothetical protein
MFNKCMFKSVRQAEIKLTGRFKLLSIFLQSYPDHKLI